MFRSAVRSMAAPRHGLGPNVRDSASALCATIAPHPWEASVIRVMVVDDHEFVRSMMCELIDDADDMQVVGEAPDGVHAVSVARETTPDVMLMDLSMPVMNGIDATREVTVSVPTVRVIVLTTSTKG